MDQYPTGPPTCGSLEDPTCKVLITDMSQGGPLAVFSFWILVFVTVTSFQSFRALHLRKHPSSPVTRGGKSGNQKNFQSDGDARAIAAAKKDIGAAESVIDVQELDEPIVRFTGYRTVIFGEICCWLLILTSILWIIIYLLVLLDAYESCQLTSMDNLCFFGTYFIFGSYELNGRVSNFLILVHQPW